ncbi:MAG: chemotaxis protein CheW [Cyclobacteriaceae bacterium]
METSEKHLIFRVKKQLFTIEVKHVKTIIQISRVFKVPQAPDFIIGVINLDGDVIPIVDAGIKLNMGKLEVTPITQIIILQNEKSDDKKMQLLGFLIDEVSDVSDIDPRKIQALPTSKYDFDERLVDGMHKVSDEFCMQVNVHNIFKGEIEDLLIQK